MPFLNQQMTNAAQALFGQMRQNAAQPSAQAPAQAAPVAQTNQQIPQVAAPISPLPVQTAKLAPQMTEQQAFDQGFNNVRNMGMVAQVQQPAPMPTQAPVAQTRPNSQLGKGPGHGQHVSQEAILSARQRHAERMRHGWQNHQQMPGMAQAPANSSPAQLAQLDALKRQQAEQQGLVQGYAGARLPN